MLVDEIANCAHLAIFNKKKMLDLPHADEPYYRFLYWLAKRMAFTTIIECGVYAGTGLAHLALGNGLTETVVVGVDTDTDHIIDIVRKMQGVKLVHGDSVQYLSSFVDKSFHFALFHLDTQHTPDQVQQELDQAIRISKRAIVCLDDIRINKEMGEWWDNLNVDGTKLEYPELHVTGYGVIITGEG